MTNIEIGQVWAHRKYFKIVTNIGGDGVTYEFYNRDEYYYEPNKRRREIKWPRPSTIEVFENLSKFKTSLKSLTLMGISKGKKPMVGVVK